MDNIALVNAYAALTIVRKHIDPRYRCTLVIEPEALLSQQDIVILTAYSKLLSIKFAMRFKPKQIGQHGADKAMADAFITQFVEAGKRKGSNGRIR